MKTDAYPEVVTTAQPPLLESIGNNEVCFRLVKDYSSWPLNLKCSLFERSDILASVLPQGLRNALVFKQDTTDSTTTEQLDRLSMGAPVFMQLEKD